MKKNNKGFSLVELIIVIAIMAILAGAIAPALIRYIDKSRKSNDVSACKTIKTAVETAMSNEDAHEALTPSGTTGLITVTIKPKTDVSSLANASTADGDQDQAPSGGGSNDGITISGTNGAESSQVTTAVAEIAKNLGGKTPKITYGKAAKDSALSNSAKPTTYFALIDANGTIYVGLGTAAPSTISSSYECTGTFHYVVPEVCKHYAK